MANWNPGQPPGPPGGPPPGGGYGGPPGGYGGPPGGAPPPGGYGAPPPGGYGAPPPGGFGGPPGFGGPQPFGMQGPGAAPVAGNMGLGFVAGFFGGCIGLALVYILAKGPATKKGAAIGFGVAFALGVLGNIIAAAAH